MTKKQEHIVFLLMGINVIVFCVIFLLISSNQRLAADDYHYLIKTRDLGIWDSAVYYYNNWNSRWASSLARAVFLNVSGSNLSFVFLNLISLVFGLISVRAILSTLVSQTKIPIKRRQHWLLASYILLILFHASIAKSDTWFWLSSTPSYLWGAFAAILGISLLFKPKTSVPRLFLSALLFTYVGGSSESVALAILIGLCYLGFITHKKVQRITVNRKALHLATIICLIAFGISLVGPGLEIRKSFLPQYAFSDKLMIGFWNYFKFNFKEIPLQLPLIILMVAPFGFLGRKHLQFQLISIREIFWANKRLWGLADLTIAFIAFALAFVMGEMGPTRTWLPITFIMVAVAVFIAYQLGTWVYIKSNGKLVHMVIATQIVLLSYQLVTGSTQITKTRAYAEAVDQRMNLIPTLHPDLSKIHQLKPLPDSGWLFSAEISSDTAHFTNDHLELFFNNRYNLMVKDRVLYPTE